MIDDITSYMLYVISKCYVFVYRFIYGKERDFHYTVYIHGSFDSLSDVDWKRIYRRNPWIYLYGIKVLICANIQLNSLEGCPSEIEELSCFENNLTSLKGCPPNVIELKCFRNHLTSLEGCPSNVVELICSYNQLTSLEGCPSTIIELSCSYNKLKTLDGCPSSVTILDCSYNQIYSLRSCPPTIRVLLCNDNQLINLDGIPNCVKCIQHFRNPMPWNEDIYTAKEKNVQRGIEKLRQIVAQKKIKRAWDRYWYEPDADGNIRFCKYAYNRM